MKRRYLLLIAAGSISVAACAAFLLVYLMGLVVKYSGLF